MKFNLKVIRTLILEAFSDEELTIFCKDHFEEVKNEFGSGMSILGKAIRLIEFCERREQLDLLLKNIEATRPEKYQKYREQLEQGAQLLEVFKVASTSEPPRYTSTETQTAQQISHPLMGDVPAIKQWFLQKLAPDEQIFVATAALFSGLDRQELLEIYRQVSDILRPAEPPPQTSPSVNMETGQGSQPIINLVISFDDKSVYKEAQPNVKVQAPSPKSPFMDESKLFGIANLHMVDGTRNTEHGLAPVRLAEMEEEQRQKMIDLLGESFAQVLEHLTPYLRELGADRRAVIRNRTAATVGELMGRIDFIRYKEEIVLPWALSDNLYMNSSVGLALAAAGKDSRYTDNVKKLLGHWITSPNPSLTWTGVASCGQLGTLWPEDILDFMETALRRGKFDLFILVVFVLQSLCQNEHAHLVLKRLAEWIDIDNQQTGPPLRGVAALIFLEAIEFSHITSDNVDNAVSIFLVGLKNDRRLNDAGLIQSVMVEKLKGWAEESFGEEEKEALIATLFSRLYVRAGTQREKDRIAFYLRRWQQRDKDKRFGRIAPTLVH
jgi:hypothetical protein